MVQPGLRPHQLVRSHHGLALCRAVLPGLGHALCVLGHVAGAEEGVAVKIKTSELTGRALDWAMALVMGMSWWTPHTARWSTADGYTDWVLAADGRLKKYVFDGSSSRSVHWDIQ